MYKFIKINGIIWLVVTNQRKLIMQNIEFDFDKTKHVMFSKECEREMKNKISLNYLLKKNKIRKVVFSVLDKCFFIELIRGG